MKEIKPKRSNHNIDVTIFIYKSNCLYISLYCQKANIQILKYRYVYFFWTIIKFHILITSDLYLIRFARLISLYILINFFKSVYLSQQHPLSEKGSNLSREINNLILIILIIQKIIYYI